VQTYHIVWELDQIRHIDNIIDFPRMSKHPETQTSIYNPPRLACDITDRNRRHDVNAIDNNQINIIVSQKHIDLPIMVNVSTGIEIFEIYEQDDLVLD
jgi:hypothetical protein